MSVTEVPCNNLDAHDPHDWGSDHQYLCPGQTAQPAQSAPVCFVDIETTGLHADRHEIWEVGLIDADGKEHAWMLETMHLDRADPIALNVGRFHERHPQGNAFTGRSFCPEDEAYQPALHEGSPVCVSHAYLAEQLLTLTHGHHLAGAVVSFDEERLRRLIWRQKLVPTWHYHLIDVEALAAGWLARAAEPGVSDARREIARPPWNSNELSRQVGVNPDDFDRHTALGDCRWAKAIYDKILGS